MLALVIKGDSFGIRVEYFARLFHVKSQKGIKKRDNIWALDPSFIRLDGFSDNWRTSRNEEEAINVYQTNQMLVDSICPCPDIL